MNQDRKLLLEVRELSKGFSDDIVSARRAGLRGILSEFLPRLRAKVPGNAHRQVLSDISFDLHKGDSLAILGGNGEGKSTLLRLIAGLIKPDEGSVHLHRRVSSVFELGAGLDDLLSGRENAELLLSWHNHRAVAAGVEAVRMFADLGDKFDLPVQYYSSGMRARLAYAIAIQNEADLLLLDEVLAVGDQIFREKCLKHIEAHRERGGSLIFVSHNPELVFQCCNKAIVLRDGVIAKSGDVAACLDFYAMHMPQFRKDREKKARTEFCTVKIDEARWYDGRIEASVVVHSKKPLRCYIVASLSRKDGLEGADQIFIDPQERTMPVGETHFQFRREAIELQKGVSYLGIMLIDIDTGKALTRSDVSGGYSHIYHTLADETSRTGSPA